MEKQYRKLSELKNWDKNPRSIKEKDFERLKKQITELGQFKPLIITEDGTVLGGNMRLRAYKALGVDNLWVEVVNAPDEATKLRFALADNDRAGYYDSDLLANLVPDFPDFEWQDYAVDLKEPETLQQLIDSFKPVVEDEVPEVPEEPISKYGEVYQLGRHRLMCGDATKIEDVEKLMNGQKADMVFTDPPYGIEVVGKDGKIGGNSNTYSPVINDNVDMDVSFLLNYAPKVIIWGGNYLAHYLPRGGRWLVWDKLRAEGLNFSDCELAWTNLDGIIVVKYSVKWDGWRREEREEPLHPTMKSVKMLSMVLKDYSEENNIIQDLFGGSGSTLIACEQTNRTCYMMELDPKYCDVIRKRYENFITK